MKKWRLVTSVIAKWCLESLQKGTMLGNIFGFALVLYKGNSVMASNGQNTIVDAFIFVEWQVFCSLSLDLLRIYSASLILVDFFFSVPDAGQHGCPNMGRRRIANGKYWGNVLGLRSHTAQIPSCITSHHSLCTASWIFENSFYCIGVMHASNRSLNDSNNYEVEEFVIVLKLFSQTM